MAVSVMQMTTTRPTGTFSTHFAQRWLSTSVSLYLRPSHLAALRLPPRSHLARAARALDVVRALHRLRTGAGVRRGRGGSVCVGGLHKLKRSVEM